MHIVSTEVPHQKKGNRHVDAFERAKAITEIKKQALSMPAMTEMHTG